MIEQPANGIDESMVIAGELCEATGGERYVVLNPADSKEVGTAPLGTPADAMAAIDAAERAGDKWRAIGVEERARLLETAVEAVAAEHDGLSQLLTAEQGKPLHEARAEVSSFIQRMRAFVRIARGNADGHVPLVSAVPGRRSVAASDTRPAVGLVAWNYPVGLAAKKIGPNLLVGRGVVLKPALTTPLTTLRLVRLMNHAGLPEGILNCVSGRGDVIGQALAADSRVGRIHLSGSDHTGRAVARSVRSVQPEMILELAGSDAMVICADADVAAAAAAATIGRFKNAGQACIAVKRVYVDRDVYPEFVLRLRDEVNRLEPGDGRLEARPPRIRMGPLHTAAQLERVEAQLGDALQCGASVVAGGGRPVLETLRSGHFLEPTLVAHGPQSSRLLTEEVFGPVLPVVQTCGLYDALIRANESAWDLNASIWTSDRAIIDTARARLKCRSLWINRLPFGFEAPDRTERSGLHGRLS